MHKKHITYQMVPPHNHRVNLVERAIQTFKNHFKAGLSTLHPEFTIAEWDRLLPHVFFTLNVLRPSNINPRLLAHIFLDNLISTKEPWHLQAPKLSIEHRKI